MTNASDTTRRINRRELRAALASATTPAHDTDALARLACLLHELAFDEPPRWWHARELSYTHTQAAHQPGGSAELTLEVVSSGQIVHSHLRSAARGAPGANLADTLEAGYRLETRIASATLGAVCVAACAYRPQTASGPVAHAMSHRGQVTVRSVAGIHRRDPTLLSAIPWTSWLPNEPVRLELALGDPHTTRALGRNCTTGERRGADAAWLYADWQHPWPTGAWLCTTSGRRIRACLTACHDGFTLDDWEPQGSAPEPGTSAAFDAHVRPFTAPPRGVAADDGCTGQSETRRWRVVPEPFGTLRVSGRNAGTVRWYGDADRLALALAFAASS